MLKLYGILDTIIMLLLMGLDSRDTEPLISNKQFLIKKQVI